MGEVETFDFTKDGFSFDEIVGGGTSPPYTNTNAKKPAAEPSAAQQEKLVHKQVPMPRPRVGSSVLNGLAANPRRP